MPRMIRHSLSGYTAVLTVLTAVLGDSRLLFGCHICSYCSPCVLRSLSLCCASVMLDVANVGFVVTVLIQLLGAVLVVVPCWVRLWQWRSEHHIITKACLLLLIPDLVMIVDFVPIHIRDLIAGELVDDSYCRASAYLIVACILASNVGNITVALVTRRMLDPKDQKVTTRTLYASAAVGWTLGIALASYFLGQGYLGSHRGVYCCTNQVRRADIAGPVFFVFAVCIAAMVYLYRTAYVQVASVVMPSSRLTEKEASTGSEGGGAAASPQAATGKNQRMSPHQPGPILVSVISGQNKSSESREAEETIANIAAAQEVQLTADTDEDTAASPPTAAAAPAQLNVGSSPTAQRPPMSATLRSPHSRAVAQQSAAQSIARRATLMVLTYYACWSLISLNAVFDLAGWSDRSLWWDVVAACAAKCQPTIDAYILLSSMNKVHERRQAVRTRSAESSVSLPPRLQVKVDPAAIWKNDALSPKGQSAMLSPSSLRNSRLVSNGAVTPRGPPSAVSGAQPASPAVASSPPPVESPPPASPSPPPTEDSMRSEAEAHQAAAAANTVTHRRTVSSEVGQYT